MFNKELILRSFGMLLNGTRATFSWDKDPLQILECSDSSNDDLLQGEAVYIVLIIWLLLWCVTSHTFIYHVSLTNSISLGSYETAMKTLLIYIIAMGEN